MGDTSVTQLAVEVLGAPDVSPDTSVTQIVVEVLGPPQVSPDTSVTQLVVEVLGVAQNQCWTVCMGKRFLYTEANWSMPLTAKFYFEVRMKAVTGTANARLWDVTDSVVVPESIVSTTDTSYDRIRSTAFTLTDGNEYCGQFGVDAGGTGVGMAMVIINI